MHTISVPFTVISGKDVIHLKRLGYSVMVRTIYSFMCKDISDKEIESIIKQHYQSKYGIESFSISCAILEAKTLLAQDKEHVAKHEEKRLNRLKENEKRRDIRNECRKEILTLKNKPSLTENEIKQITKLHKKIKRNHNLRELKETSIGHIVFGGKANLISHQKRMERLHKEKLMTLLNTDLDENSVNKHVVSINEQIDSSKKQWKQSRLRPLSICGEIRKQGNRFFKLSDDLKTCKITFIRKESGTKAGPSIEETVELKLAEMKGKWHTLLIELNKLAKEGKTTLFFRLNDNKLDIGYEPIVLTKCREQKKSKRKKKVQADDTLETKNQLALNPLKQDSQVIPFIHPEYFEMNKVEEDRAIGIDLNPEYIGVSVIQYNKPEILTDENIRNLDCVTLLEYKLFQVTCKVTNENNEYNKKYMAQTLSSIADQVMNLARQYRVGQIYMEQGLGNLKGKTKSKRLNGLINHWGRSVFTSILRRKAELTRCDSLKVKYHACDIYGEYLYRTRETSNGKRVKEPVIKYRTLYKNGINENDVPDDIQGMVDVSTVQEKDQCVHIHEVIPAYSSIIGNLVDWTNVNNQQALPEESNKDSSGNACATNESGLVPDSCSAGIELARRGIVRYLYGQLTSTYLPLCLEQQLLSIKKEILFKDSEVVADFAWRNSGQPETESGLSDETKDLSWVDVSKLLKKIPKCNWCKAGYIGYRNPHSMETGLVRHGYIVSNRRVRHNRGVCLKQHTQVAVNHTISTPYER